MKPVIIFICLLLSLVSHAGVTAEQILGEYWNDPLFGEAATDATVELEVLTKRIWPQSFSVKAGNKVRILVHNKTDEHHLLAFSGDLQALNESEEFRKFVLDELFHANQRKSRGQNHSHSGTGVNDAESIVKNIEQNPTVFIPKNEKKEVLIRFVEKGVVAYACMIDGHFGEEGIGSIVVE